MGYWENRQAQMMYEHMKSAEEVSQELADIYAKASRHLNYEIETVYEKYKSRHGLSDEEAKKLLNTLNDSTSIEELKQALAKDPKNAELLAKLESGAYRARIERMEQLQLEIDRTMQQVYGLEKEISTSHYVDLAIESYYRQIYDIQRQVGFQFSFAAVDPKVVTMILESEWSGENYSQRIWKNTQGLAKELKEQMLLGILVGKTEAEMAIELANKYATGAFEARRLVRTESNFINGQIQIAAYEECDAEQYEFVAVLDLRTSKKCSELDGKVFYTKDAVPGKNLNPMHPFCRSTTIIHLDDQVVRGLKRRARNPITGKNEIVPADMNYKKWYKKNVANNPKAKAAEKALKSRSGDAALYEKYRRIFGKKEVGQSLEEFQEMKYTDSEKWEKLKARKQETLNELSESKIVKLNGMLGNNEVRRWYKHMDEQIPSLLDAKETLENQAKKAHELRNKYRNQARDLMRDQKARKELDSDYPELTFEQLMDRKKSKYGLEGDAAYEDIVRSSTTTNKKFDEKAGIRE